MQATATVARPSLDATYRAAAEDELNRRAVFHPATRDPETLPCVKVAGCVVFTYIAGQTLQVSVDLDDAGEVWKTGAVPMRITVQGDTVFAADANGDPLSPEGPAPDGRWFLDYLSLHADQYATLDAALAASAARVVAEAGHTPAAVDWMAAYVQSAIRLLAGQGVEFAPGAAESVCASALTQAARAWAQAHNQRIQAAAVRGTKPARLPGS
jgi:hypothetical protein